MNRLLFICTCFLFCSSCCNKKLCPGDELPIIIVKIPETSQGNKTVTLYKIDNLTIDSSFIQISDAKNSFPIFPMDDFDDKGLDFRQFIIRYNNRSDTVRDITAKFQGVEIVCDNRWGCGRGLGNKKTTLKKLIQFGFLCRGKSHGLNDTLVLN
jgi:hypothetical protein